MSLSDEGVEVSLKEGSEHAELIIELKECSQVENVPLSVNEVFSLRSPLF